MAPPLADAVLWTQYLNRALGTNYRVEEVLDMEPEYLDQLAISIRLAERARRFWGKS